MSRPAGWARPPTSSRPSRGRTDPRSWDPVRGITPRRDWRTRSPICGHNTWSVTSTARQCAPLEAEIHSATMPGFERVYADYFQLVWRILRRLGVQASHLEDAAQDVFVVVHRQLPGFEGRSSLKTWLYAIATRVASDVKRRGRRRPTHELPPRLVAPDEGPHDAALRSEAVRVLYDLLAGLPDDQRTVFVLAELEDLGPQQIAEVLALSVNTVKSRLKRARRSFEAALARHHARDRWRKP